VRRTGSSGGGARRIWGDWKLEWELALVVGGFGYRGGGCYM
jgi:hypothetical protein